MKVVHIIFRAYASNWKGNVWSGNSLSFHHHQFRPHAALILLDGGNKQRFKDSSGNGNHGDASL